MRKKGIATKSPKTRPGDSPLAKSGHPKFGVGLNEAAKREYIEASAKNIFGRIGYQKATVKDILAEANISRRTFYAYFKSKDDVLSRLLDKFAVEIRQAKDLESPSGLKTSRELRNQLTRLAGVLIIIILENRDIIKVLFEGLSMNDKVLAPRSEKILSTFTSFIQEYIEIILKKGLIHKVDPEIASSILMGIYMELIRKMLIKGDPIPLEKWAKEILTFIDRGYIKATNR